MPTLLNPGKPLARLNPPDASLQEMKNSSFNLMRLLRSGGGSVADAKVVLKAIGEQGACMGPFDHAGLYGKHGRPLLLMGAPYQLFEADMILLGRIVDLGLDVCIGHESSYGAGTLDVRVYSRGGWLPPACSIG